MSTWPRDPVARGKQEARWVLLAQAGDREALDRLLRSVQLDLYHHLRRLTGRRALAEDVLQEVLLTVYRKLRWLREPELFRPWCWRIGTRAAWTALRRERRLPLVDATPDEEPAAPPEEDAPELAHLSRLLGHLSPASSTVLALHYLERKNLAEIAALLDLPLGTVKSRLAYGLRRVRQIFEPERPS